mgnify:CR=1 FL=1
MEKEQHLAVVSKKIDAYVQDLLPNDAGPVTANRLRWVVEQVATVAFNQGMLYALTSLLTVNQVAQRLKLSPRRVRAIARSRQRQGIPVGWQVSGSRLWLFGPEDLEWLQPDPRYRRKEK